MRRATGCAVCRGCNFRISIHALREEGDRIIGVIAGYVVDFYPRPPRGGRRSNVDPESTDRKFLSTPSARRATSIPSAGCSPQIYFYPRPPRGGRPVIGHYEMAQSTFLSTPSARRATTAPAAHTCSTLYFYPRPPRGGRPGLHFTTVHEQDFYPRPPRGGRPSRR